MLHFFLVLALAGALGFGAMPSKQLFLPVLLLLLAAGEILSEKASSLSNVLGLRRNGRLGTLLGLFSASMEIQPHEY